MPGKVAMVAIAPKAQEGLPGTPELSLEGQVEVSQARRKVHTGQRARWGQRHGVLQEHRECTLVLLESQCEWLMSMVEEKSGQGIWTL